MKLKYTGPKEIISPHGVDFKDGKEDKYVYISYAMQIFYAIHHEYEKDRIYTHTIDKELLEDSHILNKVCSLKPDFEENCRKKISDLEEELDNEIQTVKEHTELVPEELTAYKNNLIIMKDYRLQRETNKVIYQQIIELIVDEIFEHKLKQISAPFNEKFWHVLQTIQGELSHHEKRSIGSTLDTTKTEPIVITLKINSIGK
ncbi:MAG: hypothetical protein HWD90_08455 [Campylobacteraceae bacterium]|nr:hypothetical protein [Campylobacteraceae bacterium]